jgi:uncharacterized lipoprotein YajG
MKNITTMVAIAALAGLFAGCSGGGTTYSVAPQPQEKSLEQVAQEKAHSLTPAETAQINKLSQKK